MINVIASVLDPRQQAGRGLRYSIGRVNQRAQLGVAAFCAVAERTFELCPAGEVKAPALAHDEANGGHRPENHAEDERDEGLQPSLLNGSDLPNGQ